ncbi:hypothetical protein FYK55_06695 [Roseiconus nitratireducens]|uniref:Uncharacterized protein n=1 Tax=Roseiconus nitratireducens TaxID=2605748 RepID=A0A5M6DCP6_9BACT|nr:hypothetical protein [Roseiconus nitratireducens]KAA5545338.1 hypothetical protein FYK55_06695 [Roseiconus nitratireducens]
MTPQSDVVFGRQKPLGRHSSRPRLTARTPQAWQALLLLAGWMLLATHAAAQDAAPTDTPANKPVPPRVSDPSGQGADDKTTSEAVETPAGNAVSDTEPASPLEQASSSEDDLHQGDPGSEEPNVDQPNADEPDADQPAEDRPNPKQRSAGDSANTPAEQGSATGAGTPATGDAPTSLPLPVRNRDGRPLRPIGVYQSQLADVVPPSFRAVSMDELKRSLGEPNQRVLGPDRARLVSGFYDVRLVDDVLVSQLSRFVIEQDGPGIVRQRLGKVNLAIGRATGSGPSSTASLDGPHLEVDEDGSLVAVVARRAASETPTATSADAADPSPTESYRSATRSDIRFGWTLKSERLADVQKFDLRLPRTPQTRLIISTPRDVSLESDQGVLVESPGPPPDADLESRSGNIRWYVLEAGGLNRVELYAKRRSKADAEAAILVRRESRQYEIDLSGVTWSHRLTIELPRPRNTLRLRSELGTVSAVRVNSVRADHTVLRRTDGQSLVDIALPSGRSTDPPAGATRGTPAAQGMVDLITLTITGNSLWEIDDGICELPSIAFVDSNVIRTESSTQAVVTVFQPLAVAQWDLPPKWEQTVPSPPRAGETMLVADGPPIADDSAQGSWSRLRLLPKPVLAFDEVWMRLNVEESPAEVLRGKVRFRCRRLSDQRVPIELEAEPSWTIDEVTMVGSGRRIGVSPGAKEITIWPTAAEFEASTVQIDVAGHKTLERVQGRLGIPSTWMARPRHHHAARLTAFQPPKLRRFDGDSVMLDGRVEASQLDPAARSFLQPTSETLLLRQPSSGTPRVALESIDISFGVSLRYQIETEGGKVAETIVVTAETPQPIPELTILTGSPFAPEAPPEGQTDSQPTLPPFRWSLQRGDQSVTVSLPDSNVREVPEAGPGAYVVDLEDRDLRDFELVGRRTRSADQQITISLPSVRGAASQSAEVSLGPEWQCVQFPPSVQLVPGPSLDRGAEATGNLPQHLRYDPVVRPEIVIQRAPLDSMTCLIWRQTLDVTACSRNEDLFQLGAEISAKSPVNVSFDPELEVISIVRNGASYVPQRRSKGQVWIEPQRQTDQFVISFRRRHDNVAWIRACTIPKVLIAGSALRSEISYGAGDGTLLLKRPAADADVFASQVSVASPASEDTSANPDAATFTAPATLVLLDRHVAIGLGWLAAGLVFALAWAMARWLAIGPPLLLAIVLLALGAAVIWWPNQAAILAWIATPTCLAALVQSLAGWGRPEPSAVVATPESPSRASHGSSLRKRLSDLSHPSKRSLILLVALTAVGPSRTQAQNDGKSASPGNGPTKAAEAPIDLLVPLSSDHRPVGDKVYLSQRDYQSLTEANDPDQPVSVRFRSADYRVVLSQSRDDTDSIEAAIQADFQIHPSGPGTRVRLPIRAETLRRVELLTDDQSRIVRFAVDQTGFVAVTLPPGDEFRLRVTLVPEIVALQPRSATQRSTSSDPPTGVRPSIDAEDGSTSLIDADRRRELTQIRLTIPPIHTAHVIVEAPREIIVNSLGSAYGRTVFQTDLGRYEAELGPVGELSITCKLADPLGTFRSRALGRSYRITAGLNSTIVECEVDPERRIEEGESIQLTVLGPRPTGMTSIGWTMENLVPRPEDVPGDRRSGEAAQADTDESPTGRDALPSDASPSDSSPSDSSRPDSSRPDSSRPDPPTPEPNPAESQSTSGVYRFVKQTDADVPIRLMWTLPTVLNDPTSTEDSVVMPVPEVFSGSTMRSAPTLFAIESAAQIRVSELASESIPVANDVFFESWRGFRGTIDRVFLSSDGFPSFVFLRNKYPQPTLKLDHRLHIADSGMELSLRAEIMDLRPAVRRTVLSLPAGFRLTQCSVNETPLTDLSLLPTDGNQSRLGNDLSIGDRRVDGRMTIEATGQMNLPRRGTRILPRFQLHSAGDATATYRITRDRSVTVDLIEPSPEGDRDSASPWKEAVMSREDLSSGRIPVASIQNELATAESADQVKPAWSRARIRIAKRPRSGSFPCEQTMAMRYTGGQWVCDTAISIARGPCPDYIDVQIPSRWASDLQVSGAPLWVTRSSNDAVITVVRIALIDPETGKLPPADANATEQNPDARRVIITGTLDNSDQIRVSVPAVQVLGGGRREQTVAVPDRLTTETIRWRRRAVSPKPAAERWYAALGDNIQSPENYSLYGIDSGTWSIELEPLSQATVAPVALASDARVFLDQDHAFVLQRFDLMPETRDEVVVAIPSKGHLIGAWSAGRSIDPKLARASDVTEDSRPAAATKRLALPLTYSRLPQAIEILIRVPVTDGNIRDYLPTLPDLVTEQSWIAYYKIPRERQTSKLLLADVPPEESVPEFLEDRTTRRALALAASVVNAVQRSRDTLAERSDEEISRWLSPWISRYKSLAMQSGHTVQIPSPPATEARSNGEAEPDSADAGSDQPSSDSPNATKSLPAAWSPDVDVQMQWKRLDEQLLEIANRFLVKDATIPTMLFADSRFADYQPITILELDADKSLPTIEQEFYQSAAFRSSLRNLLTLLMIGVSIVLLWPFRQRVGQRMTHPALWLLMMGLLGIFLIPLPVAFTLIITAISLPGIQYLKSRRRRPRNPVSTPASTSY